MELDDSCLNVCDDEEHFHLHYACGRGNHDVVIYLLERNVPSVSGRNIADMLPFHLLCESGEVTGNDESPAYLY